MKFYRNTDERFGDTEVTFEIDEAVRGMKPILTQWAKERVDRGEYDGTVEDSIKDMIAEFVGQCEEVE